jgi:hypothetical protein
MSLFNRIPVRTGPAEYAEPYDERSLLKMPANALVNLVYLLIGVYWLCRILCMRTLADGWWWYAGYASGGILYGIIQFTRIITQNRSAAIADQWTTLPFFSGVAAWSLTILCGDAILPWQAGIFFISILSYLSVPWCRYEPVLGIHILAAVIAALTVLHRTGGAGLVPFIATLLCCFFFISLKLLDHRLSRFALFRRLTGHFWSKIADAMQLHFILLFFSASSTFRGMA